MADRQSSTPEERIQIFLDLADYYFELTDAFPVTSSVIMGADRSPEQIQDQWNRIFRLAAIRKFFLNTRDNVYIPKVLDSCRQLLTPSEWPVVETGVTSFNAVLSSSIFRVKFSEDGLDRGIPELVEDFLNGKLLHGDAAKWKRHQLEKSALEPVLNVRLVEFEHYLMTAKKSIEMWIEKGLINL